MGKQPGLPPRNLPEPMFSSASMPPEAFVFPHGPPDQKVVEMPEDRSQRGPIEAPVVLNPAPNNWIPHARQFIDGFNKGDVKSALAACADQVSIIDEFAPYEWHGAGACAAAVPAHAVDGIGDIGGGAQRGEQRQQQQDLASGARVGHCSLMTPGRDPDQFTTTGWPWRPGNEFRLLADGGEFFARMLQAIDAANRYVLLEMYLVRSGAIATRFIEAFAQAARRGARVCVVLDAFGALGLTRADRRRLLDAGVELRFFNPLRLKNRLSNLLRHFQTVPAHQTHDRPGEGPLLKLLETPLGSKGPETSVSFHF